MCVVAAACVAFLVILAVHAVVVAAVAVALLFAAVSEGGEAEVPCSVDGDEAVPCPQGGEAEVPCSVDGDAGFLVSGFWQEASWQLAS